MQRLLKWLLLTGLAGLWATTAPAAVHGANPPDAAPDDLAHAGDTVLVVGDSISASYGMQTEEGWVNLLRDRLRGVSTVVNASISGDTTGGGVSRLDKTLAEHRPSIVIIELGGNDGLRGYPVANIRANLLAMTEAVIAAGAEPILAGMQIPPNYGPAYTEAFRRMYVDIAALTGARLVPFLLEGVATDRDLMQRDGIHPTASAQPRLLDNVWEVLKPLLEGGSGADGD